MIKRSEERSCGMYLTPVSFRGRMREASPREFLFVHLFVYRGEALCKR